MHVIYLIFEFRRSGLRKATGQRSIEATG